MKKEKKKKNWPKVDSNSRTKKWNDILRLKWDAGRNFALEKVLDINSI